MLPLNREDGLSSVVSAAISTSVPVFKGVNMTKDTRISGSSAQITTPPIGTSHLFQLKDFKDIL